MSNPEAKPMLTKDERNVIQSHARDGGIAAYIAYRQVNASHDAADARIAELEAMLAQREWRPMESAPKGEVILLFGRLCRGPGFTDGHPQGEFRAVGYWCRIDEAWSLTDTTYAGPFFAPTHWMPLPAAPHAPMGS